MNQENIKEAVSKKHLGAVLLYGLFFVLMLCMISNKLLLHLDEVYSYCLANTPIRVHLLPNGNTSIEHFTAPGAYLYVPSENGLCAVTAVLPNQRFDYANTWKNQQMDTHPPFYYLLLHTVCSFFPGVFSMWFAGIINILFALCILFLLRRLVRLLTNDDFIVSAVSLAFVLSSAMLNATAFLRMYVTAMFWVTLLTYLILRLCDREISFKLCLPLFFAAYLGILTHYHFAVYDVLISFVFFCLLLRGRKYYDALKFSAVQFLAGSCAFATFPAMYDHLFHRVRGMDTLSNLSGSEVSYSQRLSLYLGIVNKQLFGGLFFVFAAFAVYLAVRRMSGKKKPDGNEAENNAACSRYAVIFIPCTLFLLFVAKTVPFSDWVNDGRYIHMIIPVLFAAMLSQVFEGIGCLTKDGVRKYAIAACALLVITGSFCFTDWNRHYLYRADRETYELSQIFSDADCIWLQERDLLLCSLFEVSRFKSLIWFDMTRFAPERMRECNPVNRLVICITHFSPFNTDAVLNNYLQYMPEHERYSVIKRPMFFDQGAMYFLEKH